MKHFVTLFVLLASFTAARAGFVGDPAPSLKIASWAKGQAVDLGKLKGKQPAVIEFWATWCPPCLQSIPHLTELQKKYPNVVFVGVSSEPAGVVRKFVDKQGAQMDYRVAVDDNNETMMAYMGAVGSDYIPRAFVVDAQGRVAWHGSPLHGLDQVLEEVVAGKADLALNAKRVDAQTKLQEFLMQLQQGASPVKLKALGAELDEAERQLGGIYPGEKFRSADYFQQADFQATATAYQNAVMGDAPAARQEELEKKLRESAPANFAADVFKQKLALRKKLSDYYRAVAGETPTNNLPELTRAVDGIEDGEPVLFAQFALALLTQNEVKVRDVPFINRLAEKAVRLNGGQAPSLLHVLAAAQFEAGKVTEAVTNEKKAVSLATDDGMREELSATLKRYESVLKSGK